MIQHDLGKNILLQFDDEPHSIAVAFIAHFTDPLDAFLADQLTDLRGQARLVHLIRNLGNHDLLTIRAFDLFDFRHGAHDDGAAPGGVGLMDPGASINASAGWEIRPLHVLHQVFDRRIRITDQRDGGVDDFPQVVGRDIRRHTYGDASRAVDQKVRETGRKNQGFFAGFIEVWPEIDGCLLDVRQKLHRQLGEPAFRVPVGRGRVAIDRTEVALAVDQRVSHGKILSHADEGIVHTRITVRMVVSENLSDDFCALRVRGTRC